MCRREKALFLTGLLVLMSALPLSVSTMSVSYEDSPTRQTTPVGSPDPEARTLVSEFYSFFDFGPGWTASQIHDVWGARGDVYGEDWVISGDTQAGQPAFPVIYIWGPPQGTLGDTWYYTTFRLRVAGRNLPEINIDNIGGKNSPAYPSGETGFIPYNLTGGLEPGVTGGTAEIDWYNQYFDRERQDELGVSDAFYDGYAAELTGTITLDEAATKKILGLNATEYNSLVADPTGWWVANEGAVDDAWTAWLYSEDTKERVSIYCLNEWPFGVLGPALSLDLTYTAASKVVITIHLVNAGFECLLARWFKETFMPGYEYYYSDITLNMTIRPETSDLDLDMAEDYSMYMWSEESEPYADGCWGWESYLGDTIPSPSPERPSDFDPYVYPNGTYKQYYIVPPGHELYDDYRDMDYVPALWNLQEGETLIFNFSNVYEQWADGKKLWVYNQKPWGADQTPLDTIEKEYGVIEPGYIEPWPEDFPDQIVYNNATHTLTFTGPINMSEWSKANLEEDWMAFADEEYPEGVLPWGCPILEFNVVPPPPGLEPEEEAWALPTEIIIGIIVVIAIFVAVAGYAIIRRRKPTPK